jgi:hypothetical protein
MKNENFKFSLCNFQFEIPYSSRSAIQAIDERPSMSKLNASHHFDAPRRSGAIAAASDMTKPTTIATTMIRETTSGFLPDSDFGICRVAETLFGSFPPEGGGWLLIEIPSCEKNRVVFREAKGDTPLWQSASSGPSLNS